jgi:hypothetical protein
VLRLGLSFLALAVGCGPTPDAPTQVRRTRYELATGAVGLSGLARDEQGTLWAVPERDRSLLALGQDGRVLREVRLEGVPEHCDTEAIAYLDEGRFALGTEASGGTEHRDVVLEVDVDGDVARVVETLTVDYAQLGVEAADREGIEGLCFAAGRLVVGLEHPQPEGNARFAAFAVRGGRDSAWWGFRARLTSDFGEISALSCQAFGDRVTVYAIERGLGPLSLTGTRSWTSRVLAFDLPAEPGATVPTRVVVDLDQQIAERPNLEGLEVVGEDLWLVVDNHYGRVTGPSLLFHFPGLVD